MDEEGRRVFEEFRRDPVANLKLLHYPPNAKREGDEGEESIGGTLATPIKQIHLTEFKLVRMQILAVRQSCSNNLLA